MLCDPVGPSWLKNLYFAYLLVLRAVAKMGNYWTDHHFYTGNMPDDQSVNEKVMQIVETAKYDNVVCKIIIVTAIL